MEKTSSITVNPQKGFEEVKVLKSKTLILKKKLLKALLLLQKARSVAFGKLTKARDKVQKLRQYELKLKQRGTMSNLTKSKRKELAEKVKSGLRNARAGLKQAEKYYNTINEKEKKCIEKLKGLSS